MLDGEGLDCVSFPLESIFEIAYKLSRCCIFLTQCVALRSTLIEFVLRESLSLTVLLASCYNFLYRFLELFVKPVRVLTRKVELLFGDLYMILYHERGHRDSYLCIHLICIRLSLFVLNLRQTALEIENSSIRCLNI